MTELGHSREIDSVQAAATACGAVGEGAAELSRMTTGRRKGDRSGFAEHGCGRETAARDQESNVMPYSLLPRIPVIPTGPTAFPKRVSPWGRFRHSDITFFPAGIWPGFGARLMGYGVNASGLSREPLI
jgi:hypothetical protein